MPPMTPWAKVRYDAEKPGYGTRGGPDGNDPILQCDPIGFPRIMYMPLPIEFIQVPGRVVQFFEREHEYRTIWTDGRSLPQDPDPTWFGYAVGHWEGDDTLVVESAGYNDRTWLAPTGFPHSEDMHISERYRRVDSDTFQYQITITDPKAYTRPAVGPAENLSAQARRGAGRAPLRLVGRKFFCKKNPGTCRRQAREMTGIHPRIASYKGERE